MVTKKTKKSEKEMLFIADDVPDKCPNCKVLIHYKTNTRGEVITKCFKCHYSFVE